MAERIAMVYEGQIIAVDNPDNIKNSTDKRVSEFIHGGKS
jgi:phospholipid/cholesterol/gamma-HCH transport system ATP-binding protein